MDASILKKRYENAYIYMYVCITFVGGEARSLVTIKVPVFSKLDHRLNFNGGIYGEKLCRGF